MLQLNTMVLFIMMVLVTYRGHANPTISTSTPTPCYGDVVTLVCHHPEVVSNRSRYFAQTPVWKEDDTIITIADGTIYTTETVADLTQTLLNITITVDHFRDKSFKYSCELLLANKKGWPSGEVETSEEVTVDPVVASHPPKITTIESLTERNTCTLTWTHNTVCFNTSDIQYVVSWVNLASGGGLNGTTVERNFTIRTGMRGVYRVTITATVRGVSSVGGVTANWEDSRTEVLVHAGQPTAQGTEGGACLGQPFYLTCLHGYTTDYDITWSVNGIGIGNGNLVYAVKGDILAVTSITEDLFSNVVTTFKCSVLLNGTKITGDSYLMDPIERPLSPEVMVIDSTPYTIVLTLDHSDVCFEDYTFHYKISWSRENAVWSLPVEVPLIPSYTITGLSPGSEYRVRVLAESKEDSVVVSGPVTVRAVTLSQTGPIIGLATCFGLFFAITITMSTILLVLHVKSFKKRRNEKDLTPPRITNMDPQEYNITVRWTPQPCNYAVVYFVSWNYTNDYGTTTNGSGVSYQVTNYTIPISIQGVYTVSIQAVDGVGNVGPATSEVVRSTYPRPTADAPPCEEGPLVLTCLASGLHNDRRSHFMWMDRNGNLTNSTVYTITGPQLMIANVSALSGEEHKAIRCCEVLSNGIVVEGVHYYVEPLNHPGPPEVIIATTDSTISLAWNTALRCFESEEFTFVVIWNEIGSGTIANVTTSSSPYTISGLQPNTSYQISVQGVGGSGVVSGIRVHSVTTLADTPTKGNKSTIVVAIAVVVSVIIIVAAGLVITLMATNCLKTNVRGNYDTGSRAHDPNPSAAASSNPFSSRLSGTCYYAQIDFERNPQTTIPPPPVEGVTYAEPVVVGEEDSQTNDGETKSELPTKQQPHHNSRIFEKFRFDVVDALVSIGVNYFGAVETGKVVHFTAEYNSIHFVVTCMYTSSDVTPEDIGHVVEAKQVTGSTKGLLISNQPTIPSKRLLTLENAGCQFVSVDGYGEKGWELKMIDKFKDVLPKVANGGESEDLTISKQKTTPPLSSIIQPGLGTGPAPVQHSNNNTNNNTNKRGTVFDEHCVESQEETPLCQNDSSTSTFRSSEDKKITTFVKTEFYALDNQNARVIFSEVANDDSEHEDLRTPEQVVDSSSMVLPEYPPPPKTSPPPDYQGGLTSNDSKSHDDPFMYQGGFTTPIVGGQYTMYMPPITNGLFMSSFECKLSNEEEEVLHMRVPWEEVEEEEAIPTPVQETPLTTCSLVSPLTAASTSNLEYPEEPLPTAAFVASEKCPEMLPMAVNESLHECPDLLKADDANIYPEPDSVDTIISESTDLRPANQAPTQFSGKTHRFFDGLETAFGPSQHQQNWGLWTSKKTESIQRVRKRNDMAYNEKGKLCCTFFHWSAHLFQTALHHSGALLVV